MKSHHHIFDLQKKRLQKAEIFSLQKKILQKVEGRKKNTHSSRLSILIQKKKKKHSLTYSSISVDNRLGVLTDLHFRFVFCFLLLCLFRLLHGLQFAAGCLGFFFIFFIFFLLKRSLLCYCSLLLSKEYKQCWQDSREQTKRVTLQKETLRFLQTNLEANGMIWTLRFIQTFRLLDFFYSLDFSRSHLNSYTFQTLTQLHILDFFFFFFFFQNSHFRLQSYTFQTQSYTFCFLFWIFLFFYFLEIRFIESDSGLVLDSQSW